MKFPWGLTTIWHGDITSNGDADLVQTPLEAREAESLCNPLS